jgi:hypothetical protein
MAWRKIMSDSKNVLYKSKNNALYIKKAENWQVFDYNGFIKSNGKFAGRIFETKEKAFSFAKKYMKSIR